MGKKNPTNRVVVGFLIQSLYLFEFYRERQISLKTPENG